MSARLLPLLALVAGCVSEPTGAQYGAVAGTPVHFSGITLDPGEALDIQVLADASQPPGPSNPWESLLSPSDPPITSGTYAYDWNGTDFYVWSADLPIVPAGTSSDRWHDGGLARARVVYDGTDAPLITIDSQDCIVGMEEESLLLTAYECGGYDSGTLTLVSTANFPDEYGVPFLSRRQNGPFDSFSYYIGVDVVLPPIFVRGFPLYPDGPKATLDGFKQLNGFDGIDEASAQFYNRGDLGIGRDMHCRETDAAGSVACYVTNYGHADDFLADQHDAFAQGSFATVAMEFSANQAGQPDEVRFYVYGADGRYVSQAALDTEGDKPVPGLCLSCHGGTYDPQTATVTGASFLPFDLEQFTDADIAGGEVEAQQEDFRQLNALVLQTRTGAADTRVADVIDAMYHGDVDVPGATFDRDYVPASWQVVGSDAERILYTEVVQPYCQMCHVANNPVPLDGLADLQAYSSLISINTCGSAGASGLAMPHAQMTAKLFWESSARAHLAAILGIDDDCDGQ